MRFACSATSGNRCRFSCFLGEQGADPMDLMLPKPSEVCWKREKATRTQKLPLSFGCREFEIIHRNSQYNEPGFLNPDVHFEDVSDCHCITRVFCWFALFCWQRERKKTHKSSLQVGGFSSKKKQLMRQPPWRTKKTPKLGNIRINEARRWGRWWFRTPCTSWYGI